MRKTWRIALLLAVVLLSKRMWAQNTYKKMSVCQALKVGRLDQMSKVEIEANVESDGMHGAMLIDKECPGRGLSLGAFADYPEPSVKEFEKTLWSDGSPGTTGRTVSGRFFGKLQRDHKTKEVSIVVQRVENLLNVRTSLKLSDLP
jgi:hypothetical protein